MDIKDEILSCVSDISIRYNINIVSSEYFNDRVRFYFSVNDIITHAEDGFDKFDKELLELNDMLGLTYVSWFDGSLELIY